MYRGFYTPLNLTRKQNYTILRNRTFLHILVKKRDFVIISFNLWVFYFFFFKIELLAMFDSRSWICFWKLCRVTTFSISCNSFLHIRTFWHCFNNVAGKISAISSCIILDVPRLTMSAARQGAGKHVNCSTRCGKRLIYKLMHKYFLQNL